MPTWVPIIITLIFVPFHSVKSDHVLPKSPQSLERPMESTTTINDSNSRYFISAEGEGINDELHVIGPPKNFCENNQKPYSWQPYQCAYKGSFAYLRYIRLDPTFFNAVSCVKDSDLNGGMYSLECAVAPFEKLTLSLSCSYSHERLEFRIKDKFIPEVGACAVLCKQNKDCRQISDTGKCPEIEFPKRIQISETGKRFEGQKIGGRNFCDPENRAAQVKACIRSYVFKNAERYCPNMKQNIHRLMKDEQMYYGLGCCPQTPF